MSEADAEVVLDTIVQLQVQRRRALAHNRILMEAAIRAIGELGHMEGPRIQSAIEVLRLAIKKPEAKNE